MAKVKMRPADLAAMRRDRRRSEWRRGSEATAVAQRQKRLEELEHRGTAILSALDAYRNLAVTHADVRLRADCLRIDPARPLPPSLGGPPWPEGSSHAEIRAYDVRTRRPLARLVGKKGPALNTYLAMIYIVHAEGRETAEIRHPLAATQYRGDVPWSMLCGRHSGSLRARRERMRRDLQALERAQLVRLGRPDPHQRAAGVEFLNEAGTGDVYATPAADGTSGLLTLPSSFFTNGWHLVLTPQEIVMWLTVKDAYERLKDARADWATEGVPLTQHLRWSHYGVSGETYGALHELEEFGLITVHDPMPTRKKGKFTPPSDDERDLFEEAGSSFSPVPYQLRPTDDPFARHSLYAVARVLDEAPLPPRMMENDLTLAGLKVT